VGAEGVVEPRNEDEGDIARILLYIRDACGGLLPDGQLEITLRWSADDPTAPQECVRQDAIESPQGTRSPHVLCD
jgi:endonuclease I